MRKNIAELLVSRAPNSKAIQDVAVRCGVKEVRYPFRNEDCVLCGRCVRILQGACTCQCPGVYRPRQGPPHRPPPGRLMDYCKNCNGCIMFCPMSVTPCGGPMKKGEERLCGQCDSQLNADAQKMPVSACGANWARGSSAPVPGHLAERIKARETDGREGASADAPFFFFGHFLRVLFPCIHLPLMPCKKFPERESGLV